MGEKVRYQGKTHVSDAAKGSRRHDLHTVEELKERGDAQERNRELDDGGVVREEAREELGSGREQQRT